MAVAVHQSAVSTVDRFMKALVERRQDHAQGVLHDELVVYDAGGSGTTFRGPRAFFGFLAA
jgi:hypothetical protein